MLNTEDFQRVVSRQMLDDLRIDASEAHAPKQVKDDWQTICEWLSIKSGPTSTQHERFTDAYLAWLAKGDAPSIQLQSSFEQFSSELKGNYTLPPTKVIAVFRRLLATDEEILAKLRIDNANEVAASEQIFSELRTGQKRRVSGGSGYSGLALWLTVGCALSSAVLGFHGTNPSAVAIPALALFLYLQAFGPKSSEVQGAPSKAQIALFGLVLASGVCALGYMAGAAISLAF